MLFSVCCLLCLRFVAIGMSNSCFVLCGALYCLSGVVDCGWLWFVGCRRLLVVCCCVWLFVAAVVVLICCSLMFVGVLWLVVEVCGLVFGLVCWLFVVGFLLFGVDVRRMMC